MIRFGRVRSDLVRFPLTLVYPGRESSTHRLCQPDIVLPVCLLSYMGRRLGRVFTQGRVPEIRVHRVPPRPHRVRSDDTTDSHIDRVSGEVLTQGRHGRVVRPDPRPSRPLYRSLCTRSPRTGLLLLYRRSIRSPPAPRRLD